LFTKKELASVINSLLLNTKTFICLLKPCQRRLSSAPGQSTQSMPVREGCGSFLATCMLGQGRGGHRTQGQLLEQSLCLPAPRVESLLLHHAGGREVNQKRLETQRLKGRYFSS